MTKVATPTQKSSGKGAQGGGRRGGGRQEWSPEKASAYWKRNLRLIGVLLAIWFVVSYLLGLILANMLYGVRIGQLPMSFWFAQQGAIFVFVILIFVYCWLMDRIDKEFDVHE
jgi:putative solute:sodium symporter small subunit